MLHQEHQILKLRISSTESDIFWREADLTYEGRSKSFAS